MKGSMELLADRDPEEARKILDPVVERMMEAVHRYEGTVNQQDLYADENVGRSISYYSPVADMGEAVPGRRQVGSSAK